MSASERQAVSAMTYSDVHDAVNRTHVLRCSMLTLRCLFLFVCVSMIATTHAEGMLELKYDDPAEQWTQALPVGNGRLGAMVFGGVEEERLQLNEATLWSGGPRNWNNPRAREVLPQVRAAIFAGDYVRADDLARSMQGPYNQSYQPLGNLRLVFGNEVKAEDYRRGLDLEDGIAYVRYRQGDAQCARDVFSSYPDQLIVVRLTCDQPGRVEFRASADSPLQYATQTEGAHTLVLSGKAPAHVDPSYLPSVDPVRYDGADGEGMRFELRVRVLAERGEVYSEGSQIHVRNADAVTLLISAATSFNGADASPAHAGRDERAESSRPLQRALAHTYEQLRARHIADHRSLFDRVQLHLPGPPDRDTLSVPKRLQRFAAGENDPGLAALLYQYGRYLLIASSRPGGLPANLQGLWNESVRPPWSSNWTLNINTQMNYWPAEVANLAELHRPLFDFIDVLAAHGRETASVNYGAKGWVAHHNADIWGQTAPVGNFGGGDPVWANWPMSAPWLSQHLWEHYAFGGDTEFLRERAWPVMKGAAEFCLDWLIDDGHGHLVTAPSSSPEIKFLTSSGKPAALSMASTMDMALIWDLFTNIIEAHRVLRTDDEFVRRVKAAREKLLPPRVGARGQLQEWFQDFMEEDEHHRHVSHLFGVYPGRQITPDTPELFAAARRTLEIRGNDGTGWSLAWKINFWARFGDGDQAYSLIKNLLRPVVDNTNVSYGSGGGVYPNLFDAHPPFQIDGNFGYTAGVSEMLLQSHRGPIELLPALPKQWAEGSVRGLRARGGFRVDITWAESALSHVTVHATRSGMLTLRNGANVRRVHMRSGQSLQFDSRLRISRARTLQRTRATEPVSSDVSTPKSGAMIDRALDFLSERSTTKPIH